jgi:hypothetical protein
VNHGDDQQGRHHTEADFAQLAMMAALVELSKYNSVENQLRFFKADPVLSSVRPVLRLDIKTPLRPIL